LLDVMPERLGQCADLDGDVPMSVTDLLPDRLGQNFLEVDGRPAYTPAVFA
jgi:hypothetical protein